MNQREVDAHHEAGHAVAAYIFGVSIIEVWITPGGEGGMRHRFPNVRKGTPRWRTHCRRRAIVSLAGPIAQALFDRGNTSDPRWRIDRNDVRKWLDLIDDEGDWRMFASKAIEETFEMLLERQAWRAIEVIAGYLVTYGRLSGFQVETICKIRNVPRK